MAFKKLDSKDSVNFMQSINYKYNERGWLLSSSTSLFAMTLYYNTNAGNKAYNGNIMYQYWGVPGNLTNHYTYTYDQLNRLTSGITTADNYQESGITYDTQGNINTLTRVSAGATIDSLTYSYTLSGNPTNQLQSVVDHNASNSGLVSGTTNYTYDGNGNMRTATNALNSGQNKNITYNLLNLPGLVTVPNGTDTYTYDATGNKLRRVAVIGGITKNADYIGGIQYNGSTSSDTLSFIQTEEGKAVHNGTTYDYQYYLGDNLGNTRVTFNTKKGIAKTIQQDDYYPFGMEILRAGPHDTKNEYLYNKKELQEDFTEYDYGARFYDPIVVHWNTIDPLAEESRRWSTYNYVEDDPIRLTDPDGMSVGFDDPQQAEKEALEWGREKSAEAINRALGGDASASVGGQVGDQHDDDKKDDKDKGNQAQTGSYTNTHKSGKKYHGKGPKERAIRSGRRISKKHNDPREHTDWTPAPNDRQAFKDEDNRINTDQGGHQSDDNYNERASPGARYNREDSNPFPTLPPTGNTVPGGGVAPATKMVTTIGVAYIIYKIIVAGATIECGGCGVLVTP